MKEKSLITLKTFQKIGTLAYHAGYESTRTAFEVLLGKDVSDLGDTSENKALEIVRFLEEKIEQSKKDKSYNPPVTVNAPKTVRKNFGLEGKKKAIFIE